jgi:hypothetical protein
MAGCAGEEEYPVPINVTQNTDGSILLPAATSITVKQVAGGLQVSANDALVLPVDTGPAKQAKIDKAKADLAIATTDLGKVGADLA